MKETYKHTTNTPQKPTPSPAIAEVKSLLEYRYELECKLQSVNEQIETIRELVNA